MDTKEIAVYKELFNYPSLSMTASVAEIYIMDQLKKILYYRLNTEHNGNSGIYFHGKAISAPVEVSFFSYKPEPSVISVAEYIKNNSGLWDHTSQYFSEEFCYDSLNRSGYVTWDCFDMNAVGHALAIAGSFSEINREILKEVYLLQCETYWDPKLEDDESEDKEIILDSWEELADACKRAVADKSTTNEELETFAEDMLQMLFDRNISKEVFYENLEGILHYIFGFCDCTYREVITFKSKNIAKFLINKDAIPDSPLKELIQEAIHVVASPLDEGWCGLAGFSCLDAAEEWFTSVSFLGDDGNFHLTMHHIKPFLFLAMKKIDEWIPLILKELSPSVLMTDGDAFFVYLAFAL